MQFIMMVGLPGSGKSHFIDSHIRERDAFYEPQYRHIIVSTDDIRKEYGYQPDETKETFKIAKSRIFESVQQNRSVVFDATNLHRKSRMNILQQVKEAAGRRRLSYVCIVVPTPIKLCKYYNNTRNGVDKVPEEVIDKMAASFEIPMKGEGYDNIIFWDIYNSQQKGVVFDDNNALKPEWSSLPSQEVMNSFHQDNPYHTMTLGDHCSACGNWVYSHSKHFTKTERRILEYAALYHDIGKVYTKVYHNAKGEPTPYAHYYGHENYGAYIIMSELRALFPQDMFFRTYAIDIATMINFHMKVSFSWAQNPFSRATIRDKSLLTSRQVMMLELLGYGDRQAH